MTLERLQLTLEAMSNNHTLWQSYSRGFNSESVDVNSTPLCTGLRNETCAMPVSGNDEQQGKLVDMKTVKILRSPIQFMLSE